MIRRPPRSTRTDPLFPYPTLVRSHMPTRFVGRGYAPDTRRPSSGRYRLAVGKRCAGLFGEADFLPRRALGQQRAHKLVVESRSEEHTSELQSIMSISYDDFCLKKKTKTQ